MNILQQIFNDHFNTVANSGIHIRDAVFDNVFKMIHCGDYKHGFAVYGCPDCGEIKIVPFRCKSRFCTTCGNLYSQKRATAMSFKLIRCSHRHCVFTIPQQLRHFFRQDRLLLNNLFHSVRDVILKMFYKINKTENFTPGFISVLHTFGRSLQWNPHIHVIISEGGCGNISVWRKMKHFNYVFLRHAFRTALLNSMEKHIGSSFKKVKSYIYKHCPDGFYVYAKPNICNTKEITKYIGRYLGRPVIATSRIDHYDGQFVTFHYNRHEDDKLVVEKIHATDFIKLLIVHIPDKNFKMVRYYGIYAKDHKNSKKLSLAVPKDRRNLLRTFNQWKVSILLSFGYDPLLCKCGHHMSILEISHEGTPLIEKYRKFFDSS